MRGSGGTQGGVEPFPVGLCLAGFAVYLFLDSVQIPSGGYGWISGMMGGHRGGQSGIGQAISMGIVCVPFAIGVVSRFGCALIFKSYRIRPGQTSVTGIKPPTPEA